MATGSDFVPSDVLINTTQQGGSFTYDPQALEQQKSDRVWRLNVLQIPFLRLVGFMLLTLVALAYDQAMYETMPWRGWLALAAINLGYSLTAWLVMLLAYRRSGRLDITLFFLHADVLVWLFTLHHLEGWQVVLGLMLLARVGDTIGFSFRRALYFCHYVVLVYFGYAVWLQWSGQDVVSLAQRLAVGTALYALGIYISLTALTVTRLRERNAQAVRQAREFLQLLDRKNHDLEMQAQELAKARDAAEQASRAKSTFLATMSHEIRTPMNGILGIAQLLQAPKLNDKERLEYARIIMESSRTLQALLNDILDLSKVEAGRMELVFKPHLPEQVVQDTVTLFAESAHKKGLKLYSRCSFPPGQHYRCDAQRLRQMLTNLVGNAIKFTQQGEVRIEARERERNGDQAVLEFEVVDTGIGIMPQKLPLMFQPFTQADSSTTRQFGGTGLGLSIVRHLAEMMKGEVGVQSTPGEGSRFWFRIRAELSEAAATTQASELNEAPAPQAAAQPRAPSTEGAAVRALVVEDNPANRTIAQAMLTRIGLKVSMAEDGQEALDLIRGGQEYDVVLMDMQMPRMDGLTATREIRRWERQLGRAAIPIIALTANAYEDDRRQCLEAGMNEFLSKPISMVDLRRVIEEQLTRRRAG